jgi:uncharacterized protein (DUF58 family)
MSDANSLLDPAFMRTLEALRKSLRVRARSGGSGDATARRRGSSAEFQEHRPYSPGDDPRRIDWLAFARTGTPVTKVFRAEEDVVVRVLLDCSGSLDFGEPNKFEAARRWCAAIAYLGLCAGQRVQLVPMSSEERRPRLDMQRPTRGRATIARLLHLLAQASARGAAAISEGVDACVLRSRPGMLVVVSDFLCPPEPLRASLTRARSSGHDVVLAQVLAPEEIWPTFDGDALLVDAETSEDVEVSVDPAVLAAYQLRLRALFDALSSWARTHDAVYVRVSSDQPLEAAMRQFVSRRIEPP